VIIILGSLISWLFPTVTCAVIGLFIAGLGVGGGYSLDQSYISEIMPKRWQQIMVGIAKGSCALGFMGAAGICYMILKGDPEPQLWSDTMLIITALGVITLLMRIRWAESPRWLMLKGRTADAQQATRFFLGDGVVITPLPAAAKTKSATWGEMFRGRNLIRVIYSGIPWACEGLGVYGFGVFLPVLVLALGIDANNAQGIAKVINSVELTTVINFFILPGFALGLWLLNKINHVQLLSWGFLICALGLVILMLGYLWHWPLWVIILGFVIFEIFLNAGPHLVTFVIPSQVYPVVDRAAGAGIASMLGKVGAVAGVFFMPIWLQAGGMTLVLGISIGVMVAGAVIGWIFGGMLGIAKGAPQPN
ncbi:MAG: sugar porter family MFS transporter, partial [Muribaculaceae bacterium]|nr:sugar porter family MFS transporter [Muribaculaceae bacterium]